MSSLAQTYSQSTGLKIGEPYIRKAFFPLQYEKYITIQPFSKNQTSKCYDYWNDVLVLLGPILENSGVKIYQIGEKDEPMLNGVIPLMGQTSIPQVNYIIQNSLIHLSADSFTSHTAGAMKVPQITLFGNTSPIHHGPHWRGKGIFLESHRNNCKPSYGQEHVKTINLITPEQIVNAALELLGAVGRINRRSLFFGGAYNNKIVEWVPNFRIDPNFAKNVQIVARYDYHKDEAILFNSLTSGKMSIITKDELRLDALHQLKGNITGVTFKMDKDSNISKEYIKEFKKTGIKSNFITFENDEDWVSSKRLELFDYIQLVKVHRNPKENIINEVKRYTNDNLAGELIKNDPSLWFRSNKFTLSKEKIYLSHFHYLNDIPTDNFDNNVMNLIDDPSFFQDADHFYIFKQSIG